MRKSTLVCCSLIAMLGACGDDETSEPTPGQDISADAMVLDSSEVQSDAGVPDAVVEPGDTTLAETTGVTDTTGDASSQDVPGDAVPGDATAPEDVTPDSAEDGSSMDSQEADVSADSGVEDVTEDITVDVTEDAQDGLPEWACTAEQKCTGPEEICFGPEDDFCGMCKDPEFPCDDDGQCGGDTVCGEEAPACSCTGEIECVDPCTPGAECAIGKVCDAGGHCKPQSCADDPTACPANFSCITQGPVDMQLPGTCERTACSQSSECDDHCVKGKCHGIPGNCSPPPP